MSKLWASKSLPILAKQTQCRRMRQAPGFLLAQVPQKMMGCGVGFSRHSELLLQGVVDWFSWLMLATRGRIQMACLSAHKS